MSYSKLHFEISTYIERSKKEFLTDKFIFSSYTPPNTMYNVSNDVDEILLKKSISAIRMWHRTLSLLKRNTNPAIACSVQIKYKHYSDILSKKYYYKALSELIEANLIIATSNKFIFIVNIQYANKLFKPKLEI